MVMYLKDYFCWPKNLGALFLGGGGKGDYAQGKKRIWDLLSWWEGVNERLMKGWELKRVDERLW